MILRIAPVQLVRSQQSVVIENALKSRVTLENGDWLFVNDRHINSYRIFSCDYMGACVCAVCIWPLARMCVCVWVFLIVYGYKVCVAVYVRSLLLSWCTRKCCHVRFIEKSRIAAYNKIWNFSKNSALFVERIRFQWKYSYQTENCRLQQKNSPTLWVLCRFASTKRCPHSNAVLPYSELESLTFIHNTHIWSMIVCDSVSNVSHYNCR